MFSLCMMYNTKLASNHHIQQILSSIEYTTCITSSLCIWWGCSCWQIRWLYFIFLSHTWCILANALWKLFGWYKWTLDTYWCVLRLSPSRLKRIWCSLKSVIPLALRQFATTNQNLELLKTFVTWTTQKTLSHTSQKFLKIDPFTCTKTCSWRRKKVEYCFRMALEWYPFPLKQWQGSPNKPLL